MEYYHVVTERPMYIGQHIRFDDEHHSGVYTRVMDKKEKVNDIYANSKKYNDDTLEHHTKVALRELTMEEIRCKCYPNFPSRMSSLYVSRTLEEASKWFDFFTEIGRPTFQIVKVRVKGRAFEGNANRCFDGRKDRKYNLKMAEEYWSNDANADINNNPVVEVLVDGDIEVIEILKESIELINPTPDYIEQIWSFRQEILDADKSCEDRFAGCMSLDTSKSAEEWLEICELRKKQDTCEWTGVSVPSDTFLAVRKSDNKLVGIIDLRHHINHPILGTWGGHCGYSVRPCERGKGYAKEMLRLNIKKAKELGMEKLLITCNTENIASENTIIANGGILENMIEVDGCKMKRYWITI